MEQVTCQACRANNPASAAFCNSCGAGLQRVPEAPAPPATPTGWALATAGMDRAPEPASTDELAGDEYASWWARLGAALLDGFIVVFVFGLIAGGSALLWWALDPSGFEEFFRLVDEDDNGAESGILGFGVIALYLLTYLGWEIGWTRSRGMGKPGQRMAGFRVADSNHLGRISTGKAVGRSCSKLVVNTVGSGVGSLATAFTIGLSDRHQAVHDMMASTVCVRTSALRRRGLLGGGAAADPLATSHAVTAPARAAGSGDSGALPRTGPFV
ncbi:MAG: domain containing protein [Thermoleophilia bacterium]|nr:domain containing protein [Thermoleophilia bacterium]